MEEVYQLNSRSSRLPATNGKRMNLRLLIVFFCYPLLSCSLPTAGGSGTETINTFVALASARLHPVQL